MITTAKGRTLQVAAVPYLIKSLVLTRDDYKDGGIAQTTELIVDKYAAAIRAVAARCDPNVPTVFMGHFSVANARLSAGQIGYMANEPEVPLSVVADPAFDYVALGHIHKFQDLNRGHQPPVVYAGIERIDFGERREEKGYVLADVSRGHTDYVHSPVPTRPFLEIEVDASDAGEQPTEKIIAAVRKEDVRGAVVKLSYRILSEQQPHVAKADIRAALSEAFLVVALHEDVARDKNAVRSHLMTESLDPLQALATYCDSRETLRPRKEELLSYAARLVKEMEDEDAVKA
jgi:exonuclease SbcD